MPPAEAALTRRTLLAASACGLAALAAEGVASAAEAKPVQLPYPRLDEVFALSAVFKQDGTPVWNSEAYLGQAAWHGIVTPDLDLLPGNVIKAAADLQAKGVSVVAPRGLSAFRNPKLAPQPPITRVIADIPYATQDWLFAVDKAGFLRFSEPISHADAAEGTRLAYYLTTIGDPTPPLAVGKPAPDFAFQDADGFWRHVSSLRGRRNLLLTFFPKCFTGRCKTHLSSLRDNWPGFIAAKMDIWAVSVDPAEGERGQQEFSKFLALPFPMLPDTGRNVCLLYGAVQSTNQMSIRQSILIDTDGIVRHIDLQVQPETHGEDVLLKGKDLGML